MLCGENSNSAFCCASHNNSKTTENQSNLGVSDQNPGFRISKIYQNQFPKPHPKPLENHPRKPPLTSPNGQLQVAGDQWPIFLYANDSYDAEDPWNGLLRSGLLISVSFFYYLSSSDSPKLFTGLQTRLYFTKFHRSRTESHSIW